MVKFHSFPPLNNATISTYIERNPEMPNSNYEHLWGLLESDEELMSRLVQPLLGLPGKCRLQKGNIWAVNLDYKGARVLERAFSDCLDAVIALRPSHLKVDEPFIYVLV